MKYQLLVPTSMGIRLTPASGQPFHKGGLYSMQATSAETNVASVSSYLGLKVKVLTALVSGSPVARFIREDLMSRGMDVEAIEVPQGG
ncbi:MAG: sugar kinase, partial [Bacteroidales bacterium]|nr:sugar kinase [Bacteroidales bacterium]